MSENPVAIQTIQPVIVDSNKNSPIQSSSTLNQKQSEQQTPKSENSLEKSNQEKDSKIKTSSSLATIFAIFNTMVGSIVLLLPNNYSKCGIISSTIIMLFIAFLTHYTSQWIVQNTGKNDMNLSQVIKRILGQKWVKLYSLSSFFLLFTVGVVQFLMINSSLYTMLQFLIPKFGINIPMAQSDEISFKSELSIQWQVIAIIPLCFCFYFVKNMKFLISIQRFGAIAIYCYIAFIFYTFFENLKNDNISQNMDDLVYFSSSFESITYMIGNFALSFMVHPVLPNLISTNRDKTKNNRDVSLGYILTASGYAIIGIVSSFGILGRKAKVQDPQIIYDYYDSNDLATFCVALIFFCQQFTLCPFYNYLSKRDFFDVYLGQNKPFSKKQNLAYNIVYTVVQLLVQLFLINPNMIISIFGTVIGFLIVYIIPIQLRKNGDFQFEVEKKSDKVISKTLTQLKTQISVIEEEEENENDEQITDGQVISTLANIVDKNNNNENDDNEVKIENLDTEQNLSGSQKKRVSRKSIQNFVYKKYHTVIAQNNKITWQLKVTFALLFIIGFTQSLLSIIQILGVFE